LFICFQAVLARACSPCRYRYLADFQGTDCKSAPANFEILNFEILYFAANLRSKMLSTKCSSGIYTKTAAPYTKQPNLYTELLTDFFILK
jgi:hypothetical protein